MRGRRSDPPELQAAKGAPRQRGRGKQKALELAAQQAAELLATAPAENGDPLSPPKMLDERFPAALAVWRMFAPELTRTHRLQAHHRPIFAQFCVYYSEWVMANEDIAKHGFSQKVKTIAGGYMWRIRPEVAQRERAFQNAMDLSKHFGLTPHDEYTLFRDQRVAAQTNPGLFGRDPPSSAAPDPAAPTTTDPRPAPPTAVGGLGRFDSTPPGSRPN